MRLSDKDFVKQDSSSFLEPMRTYWTFNIHNYTQVIQFLTYQEIFSHLTNETTP